MNDTQLIAELEQAKADRDNYRRRANEMAVEVVMYMESLLDFQKPDEDIHDAIERLKAEHSAAMITIDGRQSRKEVVAELRAQLQQARDVFQRLCGEWFVPEQLRRAMNKVLEAK